MFRVATATAVAAPARTGDRPVVVLPAGFRKTLGERARVCSSGRLALSSRAKPVTAGSGGHCMQVDRPDIAVRVTACPAG